MTADVMVKWFWATPMYVGMWPAHEAERPALLSHLYELRDRAKKPIDSGVAPVAKSGLFESHFDLFDTEHAGLLKLKAYLQRSVGQIVSHVNGAKVPPEKIRVSIVDSWYHITGPGGFHDAHFHSGCSWCGIYYLQIGESGPSADGTAPSGGSRFYSPMSQGGRFLDYGNAYLDQGYMDPPIRDGMVLFFPSYLMHSGLPYRGTTDRVVIAFNSASHLDGPPSG